MRPCANAQAGVLHTWHGGVLANNCAAQFGVERDLEGILACSAIGATSARIIRQDVANAVYAFAYVRLWRLLPGNKWSCSTWHYATKLLGLEVCEVCAPGTAPAGLCDQRRRPCLLQAPVVYVQGPWERVGGGGMGVGAA